MPHCYIYTYIACLVCEALITLTLESRSNGSDFLDSMAINKQSEKCFV